ncbi:MAG: DMT family transporter [Geminicoccaceae bacterium]
MAGQGGRMTPLEWSLLGLLSVLWGGSFVFVEIGLRELTPPWLVLARLALAALTLQLVMRLTGRTIAMGPALFGRFVVMGCLNNVVPFTLIMWSQTAIDGSLAAILNATTPFWIVLLAHFLTTDERATPHKLAGIAIGWGGVVVMLGPGALAGLGHDLLPQLAVILATLFYALSGLYARRLRDVPPIAGAAWQLTASTSVMAPIVLLTQPFPAFFSLAPLTWAAVLGMALASTALAYVLFFRILRTAGPTNLMLVTLLVPVTAVILGGLVLGERLSGEQVLGMAFILAGLAVIDGRILGPLAALLKR